MGETKVQTPGLKWRRRINGQEIPVWCARADAIRAGFPIKTCNLSETPTGLLKERCERLWAEMLGFLSRKESPRTFDGTIGSAVDLYVNHPASPYHKLKASSRAPYETYLGKLRQAHGARHVQNVTGLNVMTWHEHWRAPVEPGGAPRLAAASITLVCLKNALNFAMVCGFKQCSDLREILKLLALPRSAPRSEAPTAADIERARAAAHELGRHGAAFAYALQFETAIRQWDLIGQWAPLSDPRPSSVLARGMKWIGPTWAAIDERMVLAIIPSKTERTTRRRVHIDLRLCPMVMDELARIPLEARKGPLIVNEATGLPYRGDAFAKVWRRVRDRPTLWNRDIRAGALTEGGVAGASSDDRAKMAGHVSSKMTQQVYDRDVLIGSSRVAEARAKFREKKL